jgi:hypothetical protein
MRRRHPSMCSGRSVPTPHPVRPTFPTSRLASDRPVTGSSWSTEYQAVSQCAKRQGKPTNSCLGPRHEEEVRGVSPAGVLIAAAPSFLYQCAHPLDAGQNGGPRFLVVEPIDPFLPSGLQI